MARRLSKKVWKPLFTGEFIGPVQVINPATKTQNSEAKCHKCSWTNYLRTAEEARDMLLWHLDTEHFNPPPPFVFRHNGGIG